VCADDGAAVCFAVRSMSGFGFTVYGLRFRVYVLCGQIYVARFWLESGAVYAYFEIGGDELSGLDRRRQVASSTPLQHPGR